MQRRYVTVDVFTDRKFGGNPLAVVLDAEGLDTPAMQAIAREFNYSETTFVLPAADPTNTAHVRIFEPTSELPFAGHPNVGTAFVLANEGVDVVSMRFEEVAGLVPVAILRESGMVIGAELTAPQALQILAKVPAATVAKCLSLQPEEILGDPVIASVGVRFILAEVISREALRCAQPDFGAFGAAFASADTNAIYVYCHDGGHGFDLHSRMFGPLSGIVEDPATGSATVTLAAMLAQAAPDGEATLRIEQGRDMGRPSTLLTRTIKQDGIVRSAHVGGRCVTVMRGTIDS